HRRLPGTGTALSPTRSIAAGTLKPPRIAPVYHSQRRCPAGARPRRPRSLSVSQHVIHATDTDFDATVLQSGEPVLVDFWAPWCGPCKAIGPLVDGLADSYAGRAKVVKVDVQQYPALGVKYNVRSIPMLL